jgi:hypothetical protein
VTSGYRGSIAWVLGLFALGQVEQDFDDVDAVVDEILLPLVDLAVATFPDATLLAVLR